MRTTARTRLRQLSLSARPHEPREGRNQLVLDWDDSTRPIRLAVHGEVDVATAPALRHELAEVTGRGGDVIVDCTGISFIDGCGLGVLLSASRRLQASGHVLTLTNPSPFLRQLLRITRLDSLARVAPAAPGQRPT